MATPERLTVATLNIRSIRDGWLRREPPLVGQLAATGADAVALQEVSTWSLQGPWLRWRLNRRLAPGVPRYHHWHATNRQPDGILDGESILTRLPVAKRSVLRFGIDGRLAMRATLVAPSGRTFDFVNTHLADHDKEAERLRQVDLLISWLRAVPGPVVLAGDFNARPESPVIARLKSVFRSAHETVHGEEPHHTMPPGEVGEGEWSATYDYLFVRGLTVEDCQVAFDKPDPRHPGRYASDHRGLVARLVLGTDAG